MTAPNILIPISHSRLAAFEKCPKQFYHTTIAKDFVSQQNEAAMYGDKIHKILEDCINTGKDTPPNFDFPFAQQILDKLRASSIKLEAEFTVAINRNYEPVDYYDKTGTIWYRGKYDVVATINSKALIILDWKTGKVSRDLDQLREYAVIAFHIFPEVETIQTGYVWLKESSMHTEKFYRKTYFDNLKTIYESRFDAVEKFAHKQPRLDTMPVKYTEPWAATPSKDACKWCPARYACKDVIRS